MAYKIAVASTDGIAINEHFGRAKEFLIYQVEEDGEYKLLEKRQTNNKETEGTAGHSVQSKILLLSDIEVILVNQIGDEAQRLLQSKGIIVFAINGSIDKSLKAYGKRGKLVGKVFLGSGLNDKPHGGGCCRNKRQ